MVQVLANLLSNAVKYSPGGGQVKVSSRSSRGVALISVADQGDGIPADFLPKVFERFERYEASATSRIIGTGLGLPIAHQIVEAHGGQMWVESKVGEGSTFYFTIPFATQV
jgi:signal transduction histidine kinase